MTPVRKCGFEHILYAFLSECHVNDSTWFYSHEAKAGSKVKKIKEKTKKIKKNDQHERKRSLYTTCKWALTLYSAAFGFAYLLVLAPFPINLPSFLSLVLHQRVSKYYTSTLFGCTIMLQYCCEISSSLSVS